MDKYQKNAGGSQRLSPLYLSNHRVVENGLSLCQIRAIVGNIALGVGLRDEWGPAPTKLREVAPWGILLWSTILSA